MAPPNFSSRLSVKWQMGLEKSAAPSQARLVMILKNLVNNGWWSLKCNKPTIRPMMCKFLTSIQYCLVSGSQPLVLPSSQDKPRRQLGWSFSCEEETEAQIKI